VNPTAVAKSPDKKSTEVTYEINETVKEKEDAFFDKWIKQREA
jgi:hypothetical protein